MVKRLLVPIVILTFVYICGIYGFSHLEGWDYLDSAMVVTETVTTIGAYGELFPQTQTGKLLLMGISILGVANALYVFSIIADLMGRHDERNRKILEDLMKGMKKEEAPKQ